MFTRQHRAAVSLVVALTLAPNVVPRLGPLRAAATDEVVPSVSAQEAADVKAKQAYARGAELYKAHRFTEAATAFAEGYSYKPHYAFLWNLALAYHALGDHPKAIQYYQSYLAVCPASATADRAAAQAAIADEKRSLEVPSQEPAARLTAVAATAPTTTTTAAATAPALGHATEGKPGDRKVWRKWWFWTATGAALTALGVGLGVGLAPASTAPYREVTWR